MGCLIPRLSTRFLIVLRDRLAQEEQHQNGPYANVHYLDNGDPCAEFVFTYKSIGTLFMTALMIELLQAMNVASIVRDPKSTFSEKRSREIEDDAIREENKRLKVINLRPG